MTDEGFLLNLVLWLPAAWGLVMLFMRGDDEPERRLARNMSLGMTVFVFVLSVVVFMGFNPDTADFQYVTEVPWLGPMEYKIGVDGISILFVHAARHLSELERRQAVAGIPRGLPDPRNADDRRFRVPRLVPILPLRCS